MKSEPTIIAETPHLLALAKPARLITHRDGRNEEDSLAEWVGERYPALRDVGGAWVSPQGEAIALNGVVHRLDKQTSGVVLVAKDEETFSAMKGEFKARRGEKTYCAYVHGHTGERGEVIAEIARSSEAPKRWFAKPCEKEHPRAAITEWKLMRHLIGEDGELEHVRKPPGRALGAVLFDGGVAQTVKKYRADAAPCDPSVVVEHARVSLLEVQPKTGRTHQIRVHLSSIGHPVIGDHLYGGRPVLLGFTRLALHASRIELTLHDERMIFEAPIPSDFPQECRDEEV